MAELADRSTETWGDSVGEHILEGALTQLGNVPGEETESSDLRHKAY